MTTFFNSGFGSALIGAVVGGLIALAAQLIERRGAVKDRNIDRIIRRRALGVAAVTKLKRMYEQLRALVKHFDGIKNEAGAEVPIWGWAKPVPAFPRAVELSTDELVNIFEVDSHLYNDIIQLDDCYQLAIGNYNAFVEFRAQLLLRLNAARINSLEEIVADSSTAALRGAIDTLVQQMMGYNVENEKMARDVLLRTLAALNNAVASNLGVDDGAA